MKLYTKTLCPKCLWVKNELDQVGVEVEMVNMDHDASAKQEVMDQGFMAAPILRDGDVWYGTVEEIIERIGQEAE